MMLLEAEQLCRTCSEGFSLNNISFEIEEKGVYGFLGKSGSGKSELAKLLAGVSKADSGSLFYKEREMFVGDKTDALIKKKIGYVPDTCVFDGQSTVMETLDFVGKARGVEPDKRFRQIKEAIELTGLSNKAARLISALSLSEQKRLSIAAALLGNPDVLILDDPLRYHDKIQSEEVQRLIELLGTKKVVLLFCSRPNEIEKLCAYTAILSHGEIMLWDSVEAILKTLNENGSGNLANVLEAFSNTEEEE